MGGEFSNHLSNKIIYTLWPKVGNAAWLKAQIKISNIASFINYDFAIKLFFF